MDASTRWLRARAAASDGPGGQPACCLGAHAHTLQVRGHGAIVALELVGAGADTSVLGRRRAGRRDQVALRRQHAAQGRSHLVGGEPKVAAHKCDAGADGKLVRPAAHTDQGLRHSGGSLETGSVLVKFPPLHVQGCERGHVHKVRRRRRALLTA